MAKITLVAMYNEGYSEMAEYTILSNFKNYCEIHGYELVSYLIDDIFLEGRHAQWGKIKLLRKLITEGKSDWYFFIDCDCLIMNPSIKLESFVNDAKFFIAPSGGGAPDNHLSDSCFNDNIMSSQMLIKSCQESVDFLDEIWDAPDWKENMDINEFDHEMRQIRISYQKDRWKDGMEIIEEKLFNRFWPTKNPFMVDAFPNINKNIWEPGDFIAHVTSYQTNERIEILRLLTPFVGGLLGKWEIQGNKIFTKPLVEGLGKIRLVMEREGSEVISWELDPPSRKLIYWVSYPDIRDGDVIKGFDTNGVIISTYIVRR